MLILLPVFESEPGQVTISIFFARGIPQRYSFVMQSDDGNSNEEIDFACFYPEDPQRLEKDREKINRMILQAVINKMSDVTNSLIDGEVNDLSNVWTTEDVLHFITAVMAASDCSAFDSLMENGSTHRHTRECGGTEERRRMVVFKNLNRWKIEDASSEAVAELMDAVLTQHSFFEEDCCP